MKILLVTGSLGYRGTAKAVLGYALILSRQNEVRVWAYDEDADQLEGAVLLRKHDVPVIGGRNGLASALAFKPDIVNLHRPGIARERDLDVFKTFHEIGARCIETNVFGRVDASIVGCVDLSVQVSRWDLWQWNRWKGRHYKIAGVYCPNPVDCDSYQRVSQTQICLTREKWGLPENVLVAGRIGNANWEILGGVLLAAFRRFPNLYVVHVADHSNKIPKDIVIHNRFITIPRLCGASELCQFYSSCDFTISMSAIGESFGYVNAEAMACGTPVIALSTLFHCNAQSEVICPGEGGITIARPSLLLDAIGIMANTQERLKFSERARELIVKRYSYTAVAPLLHGIFNADTHKIGHLDSTIPDEEIYQLVSGALGTYPLLQRMFFKIYYTPFVYKVASTPLRIVFRRMFGRS